MLTADAWARLSELFHQATELPETEREAFAHAQTGDDPELLQELLAMIAADSDLRYQQVITMMKQLREAGVQRVGLSVK